MTPFIAVFVSSQLSGPKAAISSEVLCLDKYRIIMLYT